MPRPLGGRAIAPQHRRDPVRLVVIGDRRDTHDLPRFLGQHVADEIVLVQPVHDQDDGARLLVVEAAVKGVVEPLVGRLALDLRQRLLGLQGIVDDEEVGAAPG